MEAVDPPFRDQAWLLPLVTVHLVTLALRSYMKQILCRTKTAASSTQARNGRRAIMQIVMQSPLMHDVFSLFLSHDVPLRENSN